MYLANDDEISELSLSARRVWIEITTRMNIFICALWSLSARRVWIEIGVEGIMNLAAAVTLCEESVD